MKNIYGYLNCMVFAATLSCVVSSCTSEKIDAPTETGLPLIADYEDNIVITVDQETNYVTFSFTGKGAMPVWIIDGKQYSTLQSFTKYYRKAGDYSIEVKVSNYNGVSDASVVKTFHIDNTIMNGFGGFDYESDFNMWKTASVADPIFWFATGDSWTEIPAPSYTKEEDGYILSLTEATTHQWQGQMKLNTDISTEASKSYDFSVILVSTTDHPGVTVKLTDSTNDKLFYFEEKVTLTANEPLCFWKSNMEGKDITNLQFVFDFGGNSAGTEMAVENIVFKDHSNDDGTILPEEDNTPEPAWVAVDSEDNLWNRTISPSFHYASNESQYEDPEMDIEGSTYTLHFSYATYSQWQNQVILTAEGLSLDSAEDYDFKVLLNSSNTIEKATVKLEDSENGNIFLFSQNVTLLAGEDVIVKAINVPGVDIAKAKLIFDFGGNPADTDVIIKDIILQTHRE